MRKLMLFFILLPGVCLAQPTSYGNFKVSDQEIIYQKVFNEESITAAKLGEYYIKLDYVSNLKHTDTGLQFDMNDVVVDYKKFQFSQVATPPIMQTGKYSGKVNIDVRDGRYRVTVNQLQMTGNIGYKNIPTKENLTGYATKNSGTLLHPDWCKPNTLGLLDQAFTDKLQYVGKDSGDW
ncbi:MAG: hypothetical protein KF687_15920 [Cyclobacteriaceae bacterium]|nr:hypothetical protein [Cyclobacteriaceae bacterium]